MSEPVILIDSLNLAFRMGYAHRLLRDEEGRPTGVLFGFLRTIADLRERVSKRLIVVWDHGVPVPGAPKPRNWRDDVVENYKATRKHDDAEYKNILAQLAPLNAAIKMLGYPSLAVMGLEADDLIGVLTQDPNLVREEIMIFSTDKDFYQLLDEYRVHILRPKKENGEFQKVFQSDVEREYGIQIGRWSEYLALGGDGSDNIKPAPGMGPKGAIKLIQSGVDLNKALAAQPAAFREKHGELWTRICQCHYAARLPITHLDPRVYPYFPGNFKAPDGHQHWASEREKKVNQEKFAQFCAARGLTTLFGARHRLFNDKPTESKACQPTGEPPKRTRTALW